MCLTISKLKTKNLKESGEEFVIRYKVVRRRNEDFESIHFKHIWKKGCNEGVATVNEVPYMPFFVTGQQRIAKSWPVATSDEVDEGIHVFVTKREGEYRLDLYKRNWSQDSAYYILEVKCFIKDLIAAGDWDGSSSEAYTKVYLEEMPQF